MDQGTHQEAIDNLEHDILAKTEGCAKGGALDKNNRIVMCSAQQQVYPLTLDAINALK